jgi:DNA-binding CsgD family transcriptional regulator
MGALSLQKLRVVLHLNAGRSYKQIAFALGISPRTVKIHVHQIARTLPGNGAAKAKVLLHCDRLLCENADELLVIRLEAHAKHAA